MMNFSRAFVYGGVFADHVAVEIGTEIWVHKTPFPGGTGSKPIEVPGLTKLLDAVKQRGSIDPAHWERLRSTSWRP